MSNPSSNPRRRHPLQDYADDFPPLPPSSRNGAPSRRHLHNRPDLSASSNRLPPNRIRPERRYGRVFTDQPVPPPSFMAAPSGVGDNMNTNAGPPPSRRTVAEIRNEFENLMQEHFGNFIHRRGLSPPAVEPPLSPRLLAQLGQGQGQSQDYAADQESRRAKRRKLDSDRLSAGFKGVLRYGKYGQVEPGQLTMEIVSCDGGLFSNEQSYAAENILQNDTSVYCTKGNRCNIVLRHQGGAAFSLKELIIKAPGSNYSSPVREGMIFISMNSDDTFDRTAKYQIQYLTPHPTAPYIRGTAEFDRRELDPILSIRHNDDGTTVTTAPRRRRPRGLDSFPGDNDDDDDDAGYRLATMPTAFNNSPPHLFRMSTDYSDDDDETDNESPRTTRRNGPPPPPPRIGSLAFEAISDSSEDGINPFDYGLDDYSFEGFRRVAGRTPAMDADMFARTVEALGSTPARTYPGTSTSSGVGMTPASQGPPQAQQGQEQGQSVGASASLATGTASTPSANQDARSTGASSQDTVRSPSEELMTPNARFYIQKDKSKCTIVFDPPVSGRFILLKMWSSRHDPLSNIDIQSVIARGFAGPRYFPSVQLR